MSAFVQLSIALHVVGPLSLVAAPRLWPLVAGGLLADHALLVAGGLAPRSRLLGPNLARLVTEEPVVALTFDDGPDPDVTPRVLAALDRRGATASFFCIGERAARHPELVGEIARAGHTVENHSYRHRNHFFVLGPSALRSEVERTQRVLSEASGRPPAYFRAPAGIRGPLLEPVLARAGLRLTSWTRRGFDTVSRDPRRIAARLLRRLAPGDIVVLHDGSASRDRAGRPVALDALDLVLDGLRRHGLRAVALPRPGDAPR